MGLVEALVWPSATFFFAAEILILRAETLFGESSRKAPGHVLIKPMHFCPSYWSVRFHTVFGIKQGALILRCLV